MNCPYSLSTRIAVAVLAWPLLLAGFCVAREEPSFQLEQAAWNATHVVVATRDDEAGGAMRVLEAWKGDRKQDDELPLEDFVLPAELRSIADGFLPVADDAKLPKGWRVREGVSPDLADQLQLHSIRLNTALEGLVKHPTSEAAEPVREVRDFWVSLPQLDGNQGRRYVSRLCARVLGAIETAPGISK